MITIDHSGALIRVAVLGEFTLADFKEFENYAVYQCHADGPLSLYLDLSEMTGVTVDMVWEEVKFSREHPNDFARIGIVTDSEWVTWSAWLQRLFVNAEILASHDPDEVRGWMGI